MRPFFFYGTFWWWLCQANSVWCCWTKACAQPRPPTTILCVTSHGKAVFRVFVPSFHSIGWTLTTVVHILVPNITIDTSLLTFGTNYKSITRVFIPTSYVLLSFVNTRLRKICKYFFSCTQDISLRNRLIAIQREKEDLWLVSLVTLFGRKCTKLWPLFIRSMPLSFL